MKSFEYNLTLEELTKRTDREYLITKKFLDVDSPEYNDLESGDKKALAYLVKAATIFDKIHMQLDNTHNLEVLEWLKEQSKKGDEKGKLSLKLFYGQKGVNAVDNLSSEVQLIKGIDNKLGKGFYPEDLTKEEFHAILTKMIHKGKIDEVKKILTQRSVVVRDNDELKGIDYIDFFKEDFIKVADLLEKARECSTNTNFNEYLELQAKALRTADPMLDAYADKKWASLQDTPLEFTITREAYEDEMTATIIENKELQKLLDENNIEVFSKDSLGCRVGIVNKEGTNNLLKIKKYLPLLADSMPYSNKYEQLLSGSDDKQTMVDVDMVITTGDVGAYRGGITLAENLPNDDKLTFKIGGGRRNVYHRQIRFVSDVAKLQKKLNEVLVKEQHKYYNEEADHLATIGHENAHTLGPKKNQEKLGKYSDIIEENKADMVSLAFLDLLLEKGMYLKEERDQIVVTEVVCNFLKSKPILSQAHRVRTVMQNKYFFDNGGYEITSDGKIKVNIEKIPQIAYKMLSEIIEVQLSGSFVEAENYVTKYFVWTNEMQIIAEKLQKIDKTLNGCVENKLADSLLEQLDKIGK